jgi:hypothetical protein
MRTITTTMGLQWHHAMDTHGMDIHESSTNFDVHTLSTAGLRIPQGLPLGYWQC